MVKVLKVAQKWVAFFIALFSKEKMMLYFIRLLRYYNIIQLKEKTMWIIVKSSRPNSEDAYIGPACERARVKPGMVYSTKEQAQEDCDKLSLVNPVGFIVKEKTVYHNFFVGFNRK